MSSTKSKTETTQTAKPNWLPVFTIVWFGQLVSLWGSSLSNIALDIWVYQQHGSATELSILILFTTLPTILLSPIAGAIVDRWDRHWVMILADSGAALSTLAMALLILNGRAQTWQICIATAISSSFSTFQWPAYSAATTLLVPQQYLGRAAGMNQFAHAMGRLIAPMLGAVLLESIQISGIIVVDLISFIVSVVSLLIVRFPRSPSVENSTTTPTSIRAETIAGFKYIIERKGLVALFLFLASINFSIGIVQVLVYPLILSFATQSQLGIILSLGGVGMVAGSLMMGVFSTDRRNYVKLLLQFMAINGLALISAGCSRSQILFAMAAMLFFFTLPIVNGSIQVILQKTVAENMQGKVFSLSTAISSAFLPLAFLIAGPLADRIFEPLMKADGLLAGSLGRIIGTGNGRGVAAIFVILGMMLISTTIIANRYRPLRSLMSSPPA